MGPPHLADAAKAVAKAHKAKFSVIVGDDLLKKNYPAVHAVGRAAARPPRLIDLNWGSSGPRLTLVGKGVCFDTGGLDLKPSSGMLLMKKDMGGAALMLALAQMIMDAGLKIRLRLLIPAVENSVSGNAYRPLDVIRTRKGITVEIGNTDAEGRVILCDALAEAHGSKAGDKPDLILDAATLTGAARVALGPDLPALFCNDDDIAEACCATARRRTTRCGACRCTRAIAPCWTARSRTSTTSAAALTPAPSPPRSICRNSSIPACAGPTSTRWPGTPATAPAGRKAARPVPARAVRVRIGLGAAEKGQRRRHHRAQGRPPPAAAEAADAAKALTPC